MDSTLNSLQIQSRVNPDSPQIKPWIHSSLTLESVLDSLQSRSGFSLGSLLSQSQIHSRLGLALTRGGWAPLCTALDWLQSDFLRAALG